MKEQPITDRLRLVSFLGTGRYEETTYCFEEREMQTRYVAHALAEIARPEEIVILATDEAWEVHGDTLSQCLTSSGLRGIERRRLMLGQNADELWRQFEVVVDAVSPASLHLQVLFDITHGFRSQPFFAAAALDFVRSLKASDTRLQVVYGAFEARRDNRTPIWDLTIFADLLDWSRSLLLFLRTGRVDEVAMPTERLGRELTKQWAVQGRQGRPPQLRRLGEALRRFGDALVTIRTGSLLCHAPQASAASQLLLTIDEVGGEVERHIPPLALVLNLIREMVAPLVTNDRLSQAGGQAALQALAQLYFRMGRYAEAAATLREADITRFASANADCPGSRNFQSQAREAAENACYQADPFRVKEISQVRNDIEHAGYRRDPMPPESIRSKVQELIQRAPGLECPGDR